jgi:hypothetical protein
MIDPRAIVLIAGSVLFGALIVAALYPDTGIDIAPPRTAGTVEAVRAVPLPQAAEVEDLLATVLARPLFSSTRRPPEIVQGESAPSPDLSDKRLAGIVIEPDRRLAIFAVNGAKPMTLSEGESVGGWRIESITPTEISLVGPSGSRTMQPTWGPSSARPRQQRNTSQQSQPAPAPGVSNQARQGNDGQASDNTPRSPARGNRASDGQASDSTPRSPARGNRASDGQASDSTPRSPARGNRATAAQNPPDAPRGNPLTPSGAGRPSQRP